LERLRGRGNGNFIYDVSMPANYTPARWSAEPLNLLSPEVVAVVNEALKEGITCGLHRFYAGGCGPEPCAFSDLNSYLRAV
jgi:hypothetical protein